MKMKLKDIKKDDFILMHTMRDGASVGRVPYKVKRIELEKKDKIVLDLILQDAEGNKKHYSFLDWEKEVDTAGYFETDVRPCCGRDKEVDKIG
jgi:hypothetical protein